MFQLHRTVILFSHFSLPYKQMLHKHGQAVLKVCALTFLVVGGVWDWEKQQRESIERKGTAAFGRQAKAKALKQYNVRVCAHTHTHAHTHSLSQNTLVSLVSLSLSTDINSLKVAFILIWLAQSIRTLGNTSSSDNY